eukprot:6209030-Pleurochrysis_carterae.AAC.2
MRCIPLDRPAAQWNASSCRCAINPSQRRARFECTESLYMRSSHDRRLQYACLCERKKGREQ